MSFERTTVTLPLSQVIQVYSGFWFCTLCACASRPGSGRYWSLTANSDAEAIGIEHLRARHGLVEVTGEIEYITQTDIARRFHVGLSTVGGWLRLYRNTDRPFPSSCENSGERPRWRVDQWPDIERWHQELKAANPRGATFPPAGFVTYAGVGVWISQPGTWVKAVLTGHRDAYAPFPKPDWYLKRPNTTSPLWSVERRREVTEWYTKQKEVTARRDRRKKVGPQ